MSRMVKVAINTMSRGGRIIASSFSDALASTVSITGAAPPRNIPGAGRPSAEAFRKDWDKLGGDMRRAVSRVRGEK